ncbi:MAG: hypothetical protein LBF79_02340 [Dysgonamonadaceae bacterium]|jgi:hypothetical protein|nr:hypothetical protein [Dysgonamonadaceae bacterium]
MKRAIYFLFAFITLMATKMNAQVTVGSIANPNVTLEVVGQSSTAGVADGVIIPRMTGNELKAKVNAGTYGDEAIFEGTLIYITAAISPLSDATGALEYVKTSGYYYLDKADKKWKGVANTRNAIQWFYMPPIPINTEAGTNKTIDLYGGYKNSIEGSSSGPAVRSDGAQVFSDIQPVLTAKDFNYYVVGYDSDLFSNISISEDGVMQYTIASTAIADDESYINIIFVRK